MTSKDGKREFCSKIQKGIAPQSKLLLERSLIKPLFSYSQIRCQDLIFVTLTGVIKVKNRFVNSGSSFSALVC